MALRRMPCLPHGSVKPQFKHRSCQPDARFFAAMTFSAAFFAVESFALMSQQFLLFSKSTGELFLHKNSDIRLRRLRGHGAKKNSQNYAERFWLGRALPNAKSMTSDRNFGKKVPVVGCWSKISVPQ
jgi:hypothetical protein